ncbi:hypothetical protein QUA00_21270 [Microcoleus sp. T2B6]|uniref:hypothetical protein n=1 Tax=Microcoleus sp. T2B6 TaxID=3055424 RepID=UPI002FD17617
MIGDDRHGLHSRTIRTAKARTVALVRLAWLASFAIVSLARSERLRGCVGLAFLRHRCD